MRAIHSYFSNTFLSNTPLVSARYQPWSRVSIEFRAFKPNTFRPQNDRDRLALPHNKVLVNNMEITLIYGWQSSQPLELLFITLKFLVTKISSKATANFGTLPAFPFLISSFFILLSTSRCEWLSSMNKWTLPLSSVQLTILSPLSLIIARIPATPSNLPASEYMFDNKTQCPTLVGSSLMTCSKDKSPGWTFFLLFWSAICSWPTF